MKAKLILVKINQNSQESKIAMILERDPVCGQVIKRIEIKDSSIFKGSRYYFCCPICKKMFDESSQAYADKGENDLPKIKLEQLNLFNKK